MELTAKRMYLRPELGDRSVETRIVVFKTNPELKEASVSNRVNHQDVVKRLLDAKTIDFGAIGKAVAELGPSLSLADEPWEGFCGTMRYFIRLFIINPHGGGGPVVEDLGGLRNAGGNIGG